MLSNVVRGLDENDFFFIVILVFCMKFVLGGIDEVSLGISNWAFSQCMTVI